MGNYPTYFASSVAPPVMFDVFFFGVIMAINWGVQGWWRMMGINGKLRHVLTEAFLTCCAIIYLFVNIGDMNGGLWWTWHEIIEGEIPGNTTSPGVSWERMASVKIPFMLIKALCVGHSLYMANIIQDKFPLGFLYFYSGESDTTVHYLYKVLLIGMKLLDVWWFITPFAILQGMSNWRWLVYNTDESIPSTFGSIGVAVIVGFAVPVVLHWFLHKQVNHGFGQSWKFYVPRYLFGAIFVFFLTCAGVFQTTIPSTEGGFWSSIGFFVLMFATTAVVCAVMYAYLLPGDKMEVMGFVNRKVNDDDFVVAEVEGPGYVKVTKGEKGSCKKQCNAHTIM